MEESEQTDASRGVSESTVTVGEHTADEHLVDSEVSISKGKVDVLLTEEVGREEEGGDGACNGEDIMVEVLGSDVYVDGVCTSRTAGDLGEVGPGVSSDSDSSLERDGKSPGADAGAITEPVVAASGGEVDEGVHCTVEGVSGVDESIEKISEQVAEGSERAIDAMVLDTETRPDDSSVVACHMDIETEAVEVEEGVDVEMSQSGSDPGGSSHNDPDDEVLNAEEIHPAQMKNFTADKGSRDDSVHSGGGSQLVREDASITVGGGEALGKGHVQERMEEGRQVVDAVVDTPADMGAKQPGISNANVWNPGIKNSSSSAADGNKNSNSLGQDAIEKAPDGISHGDGSEKVFSNSERDESSVTETNHEDPGKNDYRDDRNKISEGPNSIEESEGSVQARNSENSVAAPKEVVSTSSLSSSQSNQMDAEADVAAANDSTAFTLNIEISAGNEQNINVQTECRNMELNILANGQGDIAMKVEQAKNDTHCSTDFEDVEGMRVEYSNDVNQVCVHGEEEMEDVTDVDNGDDQVVNFAAPENFIKVHRAHYQLPPENEGDFSVSDLVWGKVRSHPWWPGQIFDPADSSEKAMKYYKKDFFLVAYFGDRTFAWNEPSQLKPFRTHFSGEEIQSNSENFQNAVECALEEVSRRSELGLACACTPGEALDMIKCQIVENAGIREESSRRYGVDKSASAKSFEPGKLIEFIRDLAKFPADGSDRLELVIAKAQLTAFYRLKGYCSLPQIQFCGLSQFQFCGGLVDDDSDTLGTETCGFVQHAAASCQDDAQTLSREEKLKGPSSSYHKRKHNLKDGLYPRKKERSLSELMGETFDNVDGENWSDGRTGTMLASPSGKKRKIADDHTDDSRTVSFAKVSGTAPLKQSFKIGDCIRRVASQLTGTPPIVKCNSERSQKPDGGVDGHAGYDPDSFLHSFDDAQRGRVSFSTEYSSLDELLFQLQEVASDPMKECGSLNVIVSFFADFRDSATSRPHLGFEGLAADKVSGKRKTPFASTIASPETFEFEDMSDTYWTDRVIQNGTEVQQSRKTKKREYQVAPHAEPDKPLQGSRRPYKKRHSVGNHATPPDKFTGSADEPSPAELVMNFSEVDSVPSERTLNSMFRRFGPLRESETEVDREGGRARVVFKRSSDAEIAYSSAGRFNIFGPRLVNYQLSYTPTTLFKAPPIPRLQDQEMHLDLSTTHFQDMQLDLSSFHDHEMQLDLSSIHDQEMQLDLSAIEYQEMDSVLDPNQHQDSKSSYTSTQLGEMQAADFSTIQYEGHHDLALTHDQELHNVFVPHHKEAKIVHTASQDQELQHNYSIQLGEMQADHALIHHDEAPVPASSQGQEMQLVSSAVKVEKTQPAIASIQEESQLVLDTIQEHRMQSDLAPSHHNGKQTVPAMTQEQDMQPVYAMGQEETGPGLETIQDQEKEAATANSTHFDKKHTVPATAPEQEMQPVLDKIQVDETSPVSTLTQEQERSPPTSSQKLVGEPIPTTTEGQEGEHAEHVLAPAEQTNQSVTGVSHEQEDTQLAVLTGDETQEETQPILAMTQELEVQQGHDSAPEELEQNHDATQSHELQPNHVSTEEHETVADSTEEHETVADFIMSQEQDEQSDCDAGPEQDVRSDHDAQPEQDVLHDNATNEAPEMQCDNGRNQEQNLQFANDINQEQDMQCANDTNQEQDMQCANDTNQEQDMQCANDSNQELEMRCGNGINQDQEMHCDNATNEEEAQSHSIAHGDQDTQSSDHKQDALTDHAMNQEMQCDNATNKEEGSQSHNATHSELDIQSDDKQETLKDHAMNQEMQCADDTSKMEEGAQPGDTTLCEQDTQSDHEQETQTDHAMDREPETQSNICTLHEQDTETELAEKHTTQDEVMQPDPATFPDAERHPDFLPTKDQEMQLGI